jgi:hypothetical protein
MSLLDYLLSPCSGPNIRNGRQAAKKTFAETSPLPPHSPPRPYPLLGRKSDSGEMVITIEGLPELQHRLRLSGWKVERLGMQLICRSGRKPRIQ